MTARTGLVLYCLVLVMIVFVIIPVGTFAVPGMVAGWKAQGLTEAPVFWQVTADLSDFFVHRWYIWFPVYVALGVWLKSKAKRQES
jgi:hypothetical protein